jgi:hypothetical protein
MTSESVGPKQETEPSNFASTVVMSPQQSDFGVTRLKRVIITTSGRKAPTKQNAKKTKAEKRKKNLCRRRHAS